MEHNEITMFMDAKVDLDKLPESIFFRHWNRCQVRIEAVKCFPCFLRITLDPREDNNCRTFQDDQQKTKHLTISINVPGVALTLASSRTKQHSYAVSWMQNRRSCYIYFALESEISCRRHMKWLRKSIKNLELHRKIMLEERRTSRGVGGVVPDCAALGPLPLLPYDESNSSWSQRVSDIYEEILDGNQQESQQRLSRRCSGTSIASGIYEEMKAPFNVSNNFESINEEMSSIPSTPPPLPPLPPQRKRFNTYETEEKAATSLSVSDEIPRSNTNPETEMAKKKKYKNVLENFFHGSGLRSKRTVSASDSCSKEQIAENADITPKSKQFIKAESMDKVVFTSPPHLNVIPIYANDDAIAAKRPKKPSSLDELLDKHCSKRNSFSSPDLSKINFVDTFDEQRIAELLNNSYSKYEEFDFVNNESLNETDFMQTKSSKASYTKPTSTTVKHTFENQNISQQIPNNFNFSASNSSAINLIASLSSQTQKNEIVFDDLSGYCVMAPIVKKMSAIDNTPLPIVQIPKSNNATAQPVEPTSSGYSTGSHCSSTSSCTNSTDGPNPLKSEEALTATVQDESVVYENMQGAIERIATQFPTKLNTPMQILDTEFTGNLYENLLAIKAAQELEQIPITNSSKISTSTPTDSPLMEPVTTPNCSDTKTIDVEEENYYQTPRKSIISIDEKVPSYYPNTCESSVRSRRRSYSPARVNSKILSQEKTPTSSNAEKSPSITTTATPVLRHFMSKKIRNERKENIYLTSPHGLVEQRSKSKTDTLIIPNININSKTAKTKKTAAHKISENVYAVTHCLKKSIGPQSNCNNNIEKKPFQFDKDVEVKDQQVQSELLHLTVLQNIDFKFESANVIEMEQLEAETKFTTIKTNTTPHRSTSSSAEHILVNKNNKIQANCANHFPESNITALSQSTITNNENVEAIDNHLTAGIKKFASLPRFKKFNLSPLRTRINNVLQRNHTPDI